MKRSRWWKRNGMRPTNSDSSNRRSIFQYFSPCSSAEGEEELVM